jgi:hypothetical protein
MSRPTHMPNPHVKARRNRRLAEATKKKGPETWVYLGSWPTELYTTENSPPYLNGYDFKPGNRVRFRWDEAYRLEWDGIVDVQGATSGTDLCQLPFEYVADRDREKPILVWNGTSQVAGRISILADSTAVTLYWPLT